MSKPTLQKVYEKLQLIKKYPDGLVLATAYDNGSPALILGLTTGDAVEGDTFTPLAIMLDQNRIDTLKPDWSTFDNIQHIIKNAEKLDNREEPDEFDYQHLTIDKYFENADF
jgi:hypothetical protein|tara:strand:- start:23 stop:358 length:336 start_codon:yes stop_codon:yes gene_type:complete